MSDETTPEPQDITSKSYQHALGVLGEFEGNAELTGAEKAQLLERPR